VLIANGKQKVNIPEVGGHGLRPVRLEQADLDGRSQYYPIDFVDIFETADRKSRFPW
jgi:hypothetical protein